MARLYLRLRQSIKGLRRAAECIEDAEAAEFLNSLAARRLRNLRQVIDQVAGGRVPIRSQTDLAGRIHRMLIQVLAEAGPAAVLDEVDRGEAALHRAVERARSASTTSGQAAVLANLSRELVSELEGIRRLRRRFDLPGVTAVGSFVKQDGGS